MQQKRVLKFAFIDLDRTLFDYDRMRKIAAYAVLKEMGLQKVAEQALHLIQHILASYGGILAELGMDDLRRAWNSPQQFILIKNLFENRSLSDDTLHALNALLKDVHCKALSVSDSHLGWSYRAYCRLHIRSALQRADLWQPFYDMLTGYRTSSHKQLQNVRGIFNDCVQKNRNVGIDKGTPTLLRLLRRHGIEPIIVSEGDPLIQREKLQLLGLNECCETVFVSGECGRSERLMPYLFQTLPVTNESGKISPRLQNSYQLTYDALLLYAEKNPFFFLRVAHSAACPKSRRRHFFRRFAWLPAHVYENLRMAIITIGDRADKDIIPSVEAFGQNMVALQVTARNNDNKHPQFESIRHATVLSAGSVQEALEELPRLLSLMINDHFINVQPRWERHWSRWGGFHNNLDHDVEVILQRNHFPNWVTIALKDLATMNKELNS